MRWGMRLGAALALVAGCLLPLLGALPLDARPLVWARSADTPTLDPHALDQNVALTLNQQIYEPLIQRDAQGKMLPALAESWTPTSDPLVWEFRLRQGVRFHDGTPFSADDVLFSIARAQQPTSELHGLLASVEQVIRVEPAVVRIRTRGPTPLLPAYLTHVLIMSKSWSENNAATRVPEPEARGQIFTSRNANGTGPFVLVSREPGVRTVLRRNDAYWGHNQSPIEVTELIYRPIPNDTERVQALLSGEVDFVQDIPVNELPKLQATKSLTVGVGPENTSIFLGLNVGAGELASSDAKERNPLADKRVREAISAAINRQAIQRTVTLGQSIPTGSIVPPSVNGYDRRLDRIPAHEPAKAKAQIAEAGFPNGFAIRLDCPGDRWVRDEAICRAIATQLAQVGITVNVAARSAADHLALIRQEPPGTDFFLLGMNVPSFDSESMLTALYHSRGSRGGALNATRYANADVDRLTQSLAAQTDFIARNQTISQLWQMLQPETIYIPLHIQTVAYATKVDVSLAVDIENLPKLRTVRFRSTQ